MSEYDEELDWTGVLDNDYEQCSEDVVDDEFEKTYNELFPLKSEQRKEINELNRKQWDCHWIDRYLNNDDD